MPVYSLENEIFVYMLTNKNGERGGSVVECWTPEREVEGSKPTAAVLCPWARHFTPRKYWLLTQEALAPSRHDWKIVDWDVKPQHKQTNKNVGMHCVDMQFLFVNNETGTCPAARALSTTTTTMMTQR